MSRTTGVIPLDVSALAALAIGALAGFAAITGSRDAMVMVAVLIPLVALVLIVHMRVGLSPWLLRGLLLWMLLEIGCRFLVVPWWTPTDGGSRLLGALWIARPSLTIGAAVHFFGLIMLTWLFGQALGGRGGDRASVAVLATAALAAMGTVAAFGALLRLLSTAFARLDLEASMRVADGSVDRQVVALIAVTFAAVLMRLRVLRS